MVSRLQNGIHALLYAGGTVTQLHKPEAAGGFARVTRPTLAKWRRVFSQKIPWGALLKISEFV